MNRIQRIRAALRDSLEKLGSPFNWEHITKQVGCSTVKSYFGPWLKSRFNLAFKFAWQKNT